MPLIEILNLRLTPSEIKAITVSLIAKEQHHVKLAEKYALEGDTEMHKIHFEQYCMFTDLRQKINDQKNEQI